MPFPSAASFTQTKWLAFFAELTAKLTHHNVLVVMEGAELLKRLLISRVSIAAFLQQGELLVRLLDCWRGCVTADHPSAGGQPSPDYDAPADAPSSSSPLSPSPSATVALNDELSFVLAESISQCVDLMWSLYADGDAYYCLLVLARAGPMVEVLADVLQTAPPQLYGITASLLQQLLALPLGHTQVGMTLTEHEEHFSGLDKATLVQLHKSASLRRHLRSLVEAVGEHGALLQHCCDVLAQLLAVQQGPRCLAAVCLFNTASKRLRKYELRSGQHNTATAAASPSSSPGAGGHTRSRLSAHEAAEDDSQLNVTITGAPRAAAVAGASTSPMPSPSPSREAAKAARAAAAACALDDLEEGLETSDGGTSPPTNARRLFDDRGSTSPLPAYRGGGAAVVDGADGQPQDISAVVDAEPAPRSCHVPPALADEALRHLTTSRSHEAFFDALDWLWCLTVADPAAVGAALTPQLYTDGLRRYMTTAPRTRRDRILFTLLLLWLGHLHSVRALRPDTHRRLLDTAAAALLPMLLAELSKEGGKGNAVASAAATGSTSASLNVSAIPATNNTTAMTTSAMALAATAGYGAAFTTLSDCSLPGGPHAGGSTFAFHGAPSTAKGYPSGDGDAAAFADPSLLLPYAAARKAQEAALLLRPSIQVILLSFLLTIYAGSDAEARAAWVCKGRVLDVAAVAVRRAEGVRSALMDTPTTIDGALSDEVYLDYALRSVRTDVTTVAVLGSRLIAAVLGSELRWGTGWQEAKAPENATAAAGEEAAAGSAVVQTELALFCPAVMPALVHIAVNNPDVTAAQEGGAASPVHYVPSNLRCNRYTSLGESALVALDAVLQYYAQSGHLQTRAGAVPVPTTAVSIEDLVRVLPAMARVSHRSVHPPVRALPYRCLLYISQRIEDVLVVLRDMPSLATAAVACVLDYSAASSQWEVAAAAEWLTVLVDLLTEAETQAAKGQAALQAPPPHVDRTFANVEEQEAGGSSSGGTRGRQRRHLFLSPAAQLNEFFHFDESPLARKLLASVTGARRNNAGSAYAMSAMLQLTIHLHAYLQNRQRLHAEQAKQRIGASVVPEVPAEAVTLPLLPAGHASLTQWVLLLQATTADNVRLTRICAAFHATASPRRDLSGQSTEGGPSPAQAHRPTPSTTVLKDAWARALTASEQIALQYTFTASVFRALDCVLRDAGARDSAAGASFITNTLLCNAVAAAVSLPTPGEVMGLLSRRFHASGSRVRAAPTAAPSSSSPPAAAAAHNAAFASPSLVFGYQAAVQWACCVGAAWVRSAYPYQRQPEEQTRTTSAGSSTGSVGGGLPRPCGASLLESLCDGCVTVMRDAAAVLSQRTRCHAAMLLSAVVEVCPGEHDPLLEARGAAMLAASTELRRTPCVSALQCRLLRRVGSAARWAVHSGEGQEGGASWLQDNLDALRASVERIRGQSGTNPVGQSPRGQRQQQRSSSPQRCSSAVLVKELQAFQVLTAVLASLVSCRGSLFVDGEEDTRKADAPLLSARQRQLLCAVLCDALSVPTLQHCVMAALPGMTDTEEGRRCFLTDISTAGDPLGRTLFGRVLALTFGMPCRWAGPAPDLRGASGTSSPLSTPQHRRSTSASPRARSPAASHPTTTPSPQLRLTGDGQEGCSGSAETHSLVVVGCDVCTRLLTRRNGEEPAGVAGSGEESQAKADTRIPSGAFLAAFVKHRGVEYLARSILEVDRSQQQQGLRQRQRLALSLPLFRCLAALTLHTSVAREVVQNTDLFSVLLEVAGTAFASHAALATVALLALRNVCFDAGLKSTLCQDSRVLLTLKAAGLRLQCVSYLVEDAAGWSLPGPTAASRPRSSADTATSPSPRTSSQPRRVPVEVFLRSDVVDAANPAAAAWATQMCQIARTQRTASPGADAAPRPPAVGAAFRDITNAVPLSASDMSTVGAEAKAKGVLQSYAYATDAEASRRQYLAATALSSLWFDNQRGKAAIADALASVPAWSVEDVQASARTAAQV